MGLFPWGVGQSLPWGWVVLRRSRIISAAMDTDDEHPWCLTLTEVPASMDALRGLTMLNIEDASLTELPAAVYTLSNLRVLTLFHLFALHTLPDGIEALVNLRLLHLRWLPYVTTLPAGLEQLPQLSTVTVFSCARLTSVAGLGLSLSIRRLRLGLLNELKFMPRRDLPVNVRHLSLSLSCYVDANNVESRRPAVAEILAQAAGLEELELHSRLPEPEIVQQLAARRARREQRERILVLMLSGARRQLRLPAEMWLLVRDVY